MTRFRWVAATAVALVVATAACSAPGPSGGPGSPTPRPAPTTSSPSPPTTGPTSTAPAPSSTAPATAPPRTVRFSAVGDIGSTDDSDAVLRAVGDRDDDFTLALGDLSYGKDGEEPRWCRFVTRRVGEHYPFELVAGNHESAGRDGDIDRFVQCLPNRLPGLVGEYGRQWYADVPATDPLLRVVMVSPGVDFGSGPLSYDEGSARHAWLRRAVTRARAAGIPWVVVGMHKPCLSIGRYECDPGTDVVDLLLETDVDLVLNGHEHVYQRTRPLALGDGCRRIRTGRLDDDCLAGGGRGTTFVTVGTGGQELRDVDTGDAEVGWFTTWSGTNRRPSFGSLAVEVTPDRLVATFEPVGGGRFTDRFVLRR